MVETSSRAIKLERLRERYEASVQAVHASRGAAGSSADVVALLIDVDPTPSLIYCRTIFRWFIVGSLRLEGVTEAKALVGRFHAQRKQLPEAVRDISVHRSPSSLKSVLDGGAP